MSDHLPYFCLLDILTKPTTRSPKYVKVNRNYDDSVHAFSADLADNMPKCSFDNHFKANPDTNYSQLSDTLSKARQQHLEPEIVKFNKYKHKLNPWMINGILHSIKFRDKLYGKLKSLKPDTDAYIAAEINLKTYRTILRRSIRLAKINYYGQLFEKCRGDIKRTWSIINDILNRNKKSSGFAKYFVINGEKISDPKVIANNFNSFFSNVGPSLSNNIKCNTTKTVKSYLKMTITSSFSFKTVSVSDVLKVIQELKNKTSYGHDNISTKILKSISHIIIDPLTLIINQSLTTGIFPCDLKIARVIPLFKKDDEHILDNYRPISLLTSISKVFEKIAFKQLYNYFHSNKLFYSHQYGFRTLHSTELAALEMTDRIIYDLDQKQLPISVFLDLSKAFDTLDHYVLLEKLQFYGLSDVPLSWF